MWKEEGNATSNTCTFGDNTFFLSEIQMQYFRKHLTNKTVNKNNSHLISSSIQTAFKHSPFLQNTVVALGSKQISSTHQRNSSDGLSRKSLSCCMK